MKKGRIYRIFSLLLGLVLLNSEAGGMNFASAQSLDVNQYAYLEQSASGENKESNVSSYLDMSELEGFAAVPGEGLLTTTGGNLGEVVVVENTVELANAIKDDIPRVVVIKGQIVAMLSNDKMDLTSATNLKNGMGVKSEGGYGLSVGSNKTIVGYDENAELYGGLKIKNENNVIISNLNIHGIWPYKGPSDTIEVAESHHVWLNHLSIWNSKDGNLDIKTGADYITVSWSKFWYEDVVCEWDTTDGTQSNREYKAGDTAYAKDHGHRLSGLIGSGAGNHDDTDMDKLHVTYHHNWFADYVNERMPRVMYGRAHVYNNYYTCSGNLYCVSVDSFGSVLIENNYFKSVKNPHQFSYLENKSLGACITARGNEYDNTKGTKATGQKNDREIPAFTYTVYDYHLNTATDVPEIVTEFSGVPKKSALSPKKGTLVKGNTETEKGDTSKELTTIAPANTPSNDKKKISYDANSKTYTYNGQNSDGSNGFYTITNPFAGKDFSETLTLQDGYPAWTKGVTIAYWAKLPANSGSVKDAAVLNFNLENDRQLYNIDSVHYERCSAYDASDADYSMGTKKKYVDTEGRIYTVLENYGSLVQYNPSYPIAGYYYTTKNGGAYHVYEQGTDPAVASNWAYLDYIGRGYYADYAYLYDEDVVYGSYSKCREALVSGSFSLYASGSMGYRQDSDNDNTLQRNPNLASYGNYTPIHKLNQFYYWANGSTYTNSSGTKSPIMTDTSSNWHYVVTVITNDWVQTYIDGTELTTDYLNYWKSSFRMQNSAEGFNLGYGHKGFYRTKTPSLDFAGDTTLLDFISDENTTLCIGGLGAGAKYIGQDNIQTPEGTQIKGLEFYDVPLTASQISATKVTLPSNYKEAALKQENTGKKKAAVIPDNELDAPITEPEKKPDDDTVKKGDVDGSGSITAEDALCILKNIVGLMEFDDTQKVIADTDENDSITSEDALWVLKYVVGIADFPHNYQWVIEKEPSAATATSIEDFGQRSYVCEKCGNVKVTESMVNVGSEVVCGVFEDDMASEALNLINRQRQFSYVGEESADGTPIGVIHPQKLSVTDELDFVAKLRAAEISQNYSHDGMKTDSENIGHGQTSGEEIYLGWCYSMSHFQTMVNEKFGKTGIASFWVDKDNSGENLYPYWVNVFQKFYDESEDNTEIIPNDETGIPDVAFYNAAVKSFDRNQDGLLSRKEAGHTAVLYMQDKGITDLTGVEYFTDATDLRFDNNEITDEALAYIKNISWELDRLSFNNNPITDATVFKDIPLQSLELNNTLISDATPLKRSYYYELSLNNTGISDISFLEGAKVQVLGLSNLGIDNIDIFNTMDLTYIDRLDLSNNNIADISPLIDLDKDRKDPVEFLNLSHNKIEKLPYVPYAKNIDLSYNKLISSKPEVGKIDADVINLSHNKLNDLEGIGEKGGRTALHLEYNEIGNDALQSLRDKTTDYLDLRYNKLTDLGALKDSDLVNYLPSALKNKFYASNGEYYFVYFFAEGNSISAKNAKENLPAEVTDAKALMSVRVFDVNRERFETINTEITWLDAQPFTGTTDNPEKSGLYSEDGVMKFYKNGKIDVFYKNLYEQDGATYYILGGRAYSDFTGYLFEDESGNCVQYKSDDFDVTRQMVYKVKDGILDIDYNGIYNLDFIYHSYSGCIYMNNGVLDRSFTGSAVLKNGSIRGDVELYFKNGIFDATFNGEFEGKSFINGVYNPNY